MTASKRIDVTTWRSGADGFFAFLADVSPQVPSAKGGFTDLVLTAREVAEIRAALDGPFRTVVLCWPRRHGKTLVSALIIIWRFLTRKTQTIAIVANSQKQTIDTAFKTITTILRQTPYTASLVRSEQIKILGDKITYETLGNVIQGYTSNPSALYGKKLSVAQVSELHAAVSDDSYQVLASSTIDTDDGVTLIDSTVGPRSSPLYTLYNLAQQQADPSLYFSHISYRSLDDALQNLPTWISAAALKSRAAQMLPAEFAQQHLNLWTAGTSALFPPSVLEKCLDSYQSDPAIIAQGAATSIGAGLDRAYGFSLNGDATVTTCVLKTLRGEDDHYFVLASDAIAFSTASGIKRALQRYQRDFGMSHAALESYNVQDVAAWCADQPFGHEIVHATSERQANAFTALYNAAAEGRLHIHPQFSRLLSELGTFEYQISRDSNRTGGIPKFEAAKGAKDDHVYSLAWAVYSLREQELNAYELNGIHCFGPRAVVPLCALNGGDLIPSCADSCRSMVKAAGMHRAYLARSNGNSLSMPAFIRTKVENIGPHTTPR